jgi:hypothetical protein
LNSPRDLSEIVEFDRKGKRLRVENYSASYNRRTRKSKRIESINQYTYNSKNLLVQIIDSTIYYDNSFGINRKLFEYDSKNYLLSRKYYKGKFKKPYNETKYTYTPYETTTTRRNDSIVLYQTTKQYDKDFYVKRKYGFYLEAKLKRVQSTVDGITNTLAYSDNKDLQRFEFNKIIKNSFDSKGQLVKSDIHGFSRNDRAYESELNYEYYKNGLLKSVRGYIPRYFKYEYWE